MNSKVTKGLYFGKAKTAALLYLLIGIACSIMTFGGFLTVMENFDGFGLFMVMVFLALAVLSFSARGRKKKETKRAKEYISIIANRNEKQLDSIAKLIGRKYDDVKKDLQKLIDAKIFKGAYIDEESRTIVLPSAAEKVAVAANAGATAAAPDAPVLETKIVTCPCCGANNKIVGPIGECEYCGTPLK